MVEQDVSFTPSFPGQLSVDAEKSEALFILRRLQSFAHVTGAMAGDDVIEWFRTRSAANPIAALSSPAQVERESSRDELLVLVSRLRGALEEGLAGVDAADAACPVRTTCPERCQKCGATADQNCGPNVRALDRFVDIARQALSLTLDGGREDNGSRAVPGIVPAATEPSPKVPQPARRLALGILNPWGDMWSWDVFETVEEAWKHVTDFWPGEPPGDINRFKIVPVEVVVSPIGDETIPPPAEPLDPAVSKSGGK